MRKVGGSIEGNPGGEAVPFVVPSLSAMDEGVVPRTSRVAPSCSAHPCQRRYRTTAVGDFVLRPQLAVQRPSSLNTSGLMVDGPSSTLSSRAVFAKAALRGI